MDKDVTEPGLRCFICGGSGIEKHTLSKVSNKGHPRILSHSELVGDAALIGRLNEDWNNGEDSKLRYHVDCKTELYSRARSISTATETANRKLFLFIIQRK